MRSPLLWLVLLCLGVFLLPGGKVGAIKVEFGWGSLSNVMEGAGNLLSDATNIALNVTNVALNATQVALSTLSEKADGFKQDARQSVLTHLESARVAIRRKMPEVGTAMQVELSSSPAHVQTQEKRVEATVEFLIDRCIELRLATVVFPDLKPKLVELAKTAWIGQQDTPQKLLQAIDHLLLNIINQLNSEEQSLQQLST